MSGPIFHGWDEPLSAKAKPQAAPADEQTIKFLAEKIQEAITEAQAADYFSQEDLWDLLHLIDDLAHQIGVSAND